jgi:hypothetical protein
MRRKSLFRKLVSVGFPFLLPMAVLATWIVTQSSGQVNDPVQILASIDPSGDGTAYLSTIVPDGTQAVWRCSSGTFLESGDQDATGRSVTWKAEPGFTDSVTVWMNSPSIADSISFLPVIREVTPSITVSSAYNLAVLDRSRSVSIPAGTYTVAAADEGLDGYDGLTVLVCHSPGGLRQGWVLFPGDTLEVNLPLGAVFEAVGVDDLESALDNTGAVLLRFNRDGGPVPGTPAPGTDPEQSEPLPDHREENEDFVEDYVI